jgi:hypothetical protein
MMAPVMEEDSNIVDTQRASVELPQASRALTVTVYDPAGAEQHTASRYQDGLRSTDALHHDESIEEAAGEGSRHSADAEQVAALAALRSAMESPKEAREVTPRDGRGSKALATAPAAGLEPLYHSITKAQASAGKPPLERASVARMQANVLSDAIAKSKPFRASMGDPTEKPMLLSAPG